MHLSSKIAAFVLTATTLWPVAANAATYEFSGSFSNPAAVSGSFTDTYNPATSALTLDQISFVVDGYSYSLANADLLVSGSTLYLGGTVNRVNGVNALNSKNDFEAIFGFDKATGDLTKISSFSLLAPTTRAIEHDLNPTFSVVSAPAVPEPATWAMMLAGFGMIGFATRCRSSVKTTVTSA